jgi:2,5-diketo-D-gluconate reductase B
MSRPTIEEMIYREKDGDSVPALGFGTWQMKGEECRKALSEALSAGFRHIDTAQAYRNEQDIGSALTSSGIPRDELFITTKVWWEYLDEAGVKKSFAESLDKLQTDHVDLLLIHWDNDSVPMDETLSAMNDLQDRGQVKHVGVSNFTVPRLEKACEVSRSPIFANQIEYHPFLGEKPIRHYCLEHGILVTAYCPIARGEVLEDRTLCEIAEAKEKTPVQVALRWLLQQEQVIAIPKSGEPSHIRDNIDVFDFELTRDEMDRIFALDRDERLIDPEFAPDWNES